MASAGEHGVTAKAVKGGVASQSKEGRKKRSATTDKNAVVKPEKAKRAKVGTVVALDKANSRKEEIARSTMVTPAILDERGSDGSASRTSVNDGNVHRSVINSTPNLAG